MAQFIGRERPARIAVGLIASMQRTSLPNRTMDTSIPLEGNGHVLARVITLRSFRVVHTRSQEFVLNYRLVIDKPVYFRRAAYDVSLPGRFIRKRGFTTLIY